MSNIRAFRKSDVFTHEIICEPPRDDENGGVDSEHYALRKSLGKHRHKRVAQQQHSEIKQHYACSDHKIEQEVEEKLGGENNTSDSSLLSFDNGEMKQRVKDPELAARNNKRAYVSAPKRIGHVLDSISHCIAELESCEQPPSVTITTDDDNDDDDEDEELPSKKASKPPMSSSKSINGDSQKLVNNSDYVVGDWTSGRMENEDEETECFVPSAAIVDSYANILHERSDDNEDAAKRLSDSLGINELRRSLERYVALTDRIEDELFEEAPKQDAPWKQMIDLFAKIDHLQRDFESFSKDTSEAVKCFEDTAFHDEMQSAPSEYLSALADQSLMWQQHD